MPDSDDDVFTTGIAQLDLGYILIWRTTEVPFKHLLSALLIFTSYAQYIPKPVTAVARDLNTGELPISQGQSRKGG